MGAQAYTLTYAGERKGTRVSHFASQVRKTSGSFSRCCSFQWKAYIRGQTPYASQRFTAPQRSTDPLLASPLLTTRGWKSRAKSKNSSWGSGSKVSTLCIKSSATLRDSGMHHALDLCRVWKTQAEKPSPRAFRSAKPGEHQSNVKSAQSSAAMDPEFACTLPQAEHVRVDHEGENGTTSCHTSKLGRWGHCMGVTTLKFNPVMVTTVSHQSIPHGTKSILRLKAQWNILPGPSTTSWNMGVLAGRRTITDGAADAPDSEGNEKTGVSFKGDASPTRVVWRSSASMDQPNICSSNYLARSQVPTPSLKTRCSGTHHRRLLHRQVMVATISKSSS